MGSRNFLVPIDLNKNAINNAVLQNLGTAPSSPAAGQMYYDTTALAPRWWDATNSAWTNVATNSAQLNGQAPSYYLNRGNHTGTQLAATISDLATTVKGYSLDQFAVPVANLNLNGYKVTNSGAPSSPNDLITKAYADALYQQQDPKPAAQWATAAALPTNTYNNGTAGVGATLTATANGALTVDGGTPALYDRIVVKNEATSAYWGLYSLTQLGDSTHPYILTRDPSMDQSNEFGGALIAVETGGTANGNGLFLFTAPESITVGSTSLAVTKINSSTAVNGSTTILNSANTLSVINAPGGGIVATASGEALDTTVAVRKYAQDVGDGSSTSIVVTHNLATTDVTVALYAKASPYSEVECDVQHTSTNTITLVFAAAPASAAYRVAVHG